MFIFAVEEIPLEGDLKLFYFFCLIGAGLVGAGIEYVRNRHEIQKLKAEIISLTGETLKSVQKSRNEYTASCSECTEAASRLINSMQQNDDLSRVSELRENLCKVMLEQTIPAYHSYTEWKQLQLSGSPKELKDFLLDDVASELRRFQGWLTVINRPNLISNLSKRPAKVDKNTVSPFYQLTRGLKGDDLEFVDSQLKRIGHDIIQAGEH